MSITVNVNGELKKLTRLFFNDNGVIREFNSVYTKNSNNEIKLIFTHDYQPEPEPEPEPDPQPLGTLNWNAENGYIYSVKNNGYNLRVKTANKVRCIITGIYYLPAGTKINVKMSNIVYNAPSYPSYTRTYIAIFDGIFTTDLVQHVLVDGTSATLTVESSDYYYISFTGGGYTGYGTDSKYYCTLTADADITITLP